MRKSSAKISSINKPSRWREITAVSILVIAVLLAVALFSYHKDDWDNFPDKDIQNKISVVGAFASHWLFNGLGVSVYALPGLLLILSVITFMRFVFPDFKSLIWRALTLISLLITIACLCDIIHPFSIEYLNIPSAGGIIGIIINEISFKNFFGNIGAFIILSGLVIIEILFLFDTSLRNGFQFIKWLGNSFILLLKNFGLFILWFGNNIFNLFCFIILSLKTKMIGWWENRQEKRKTVIVVTDDKRLKKKKTTGIANTKPQKEKIEKITPEKPAPTPPKKVEDNVEFDSEEKFLPYVLPQPELLDEPKTEDVGELEQDAIKATEKLKETFNEFGVEAEIGNVICGPVITCHEVHPAAGVQVKKITSLENDIAMAMKARSIRIIAPIPGKDAVGIELPNKHRRMVTYSQLVHTDLYDSAVEKMILPLSLGQTIDGQAFVDDLAKMPHLLVAGATGSGKSVCINTILMSLLLKFKPDELKLILVDPKHVELVPYHKLPHLLVPVLNDADKVPDALEWLIEEMNRRYKYFAKFGVRNIAGFNEKRKTDKRQMEIKVGAETRDVPESLPLIVLIIDELADLMMVAKSEVEERIIRLAQLARAAGIHMIIATQRPSTNVITGLIKANIPARIAFRTTSSIDSRVILDQLGSDKLLGMGDMLYKSPNLSSVQRIQGAFVSDDEVQRITDFIREQRPTNYVDLGITTAHKAGQEVFHDDKLDDAIRIVVGSGQASASYLQRSLRVGYARAASLIDMMEAKGIVGPKRGAKPRDILILPDDLPPPNTI